MLSILGIVVIIIATYQAYKTAKSTGRNAAVWALIVFFVGFGIQIVIPFFIGMGLAVFWIASGSTESEVREAFSGGPATIIGLISFFMSFIAIWLILRQISKIPAEKSFGLPPSPPTNFN